ncbi:MAG: urate hydroxylase PuuD [Rhodanobacteraceae bacterium]|nr:urate hydroxylase PuuD [Rhodanobacteraceae bacterium]
MPRRITTCRCWPRPTATAPTAAVEVVVLAFWTEAAAFLLRWLHVVAAIAWIGESFYFVALDRGLKSPKQGVQGLFGESWSVHGGGFYLKQKFLPAPAQLPAELHWSKWKSYTTWLSGFGLLALTYLLSPDLYLIDRGVADLSPATAVTAAIVFLVLTWFLYDLMCKVVGSRDRLLGALVAAMTLALCYVATHLFAGRAAFLLVGAALATIMSANVFFVIIPGQKRMVAALAKGETPNPLDGANGKQRSVHNTYFTLPVVFAMLSTHYGTAYAHAHNWIVLAVAMAAAAMIRQFFVLWHSGERAWRLLVAGALVLLGLLFWLSPTVRNDAAAAAVETVSSANGATMPNGVPSPAIVLPDAYGEHPDTVAIMPLLHTHCSGCHAARPTLMASAPKNLVYDTPELVETYAALIHKQVVELKIMPPGNMTQMTEAERAAIGRWFAARK